jgi:hypothetical protein
VWTWEKPFEVFAASAASSIVIAGLDRGMTTEGDDEADHHLTGSSCHDRLSSEMPYFP